MSSNKYMETMEIEECDCMGGIVFCDECTKGLGYDGVCDICDGRGTVECKNCE